MTLKLLWLLEMFGKGEKSEKKAEKHPISENKGKKHGMTSFLRFPLKTFSLLTSCPQATLFFF